MISPIHYIHIYQRPAQGSSFIKRYPVFNYQHVITNQGWFDTASCDIAVRSPSDGQFILNNCLGSYVAIYVDNPCQPIWEGLINRITFNSGSLSYTVSLDDMANRVTVVYTGAANAAAETAAVNSTGSQGLYGIKQDQIEFGSDPSAGNQRTTLANTIIAQRAFPMASITQPQGNQNIVSLELVGIFHTLEWEKVFTAVPTTATSAASTRIINVLGALANGTTFFNSADTSKVTTNAMTVPAQQRGVSRWEEFMKYAESGDGTTYWVIGITPTDKNTGLRTLYYQPANYTTVYNVREAEALRIRNLYGAVVNPWNVVPDCVVRVTDALVGTQNNVQVDPTLTYIMQVQYDANSQQVQWFGADDTTARAAFSLKRGYKKLSSPFGAPNRTIVT